MQFKPILYKGPLYSTYILNLLPGFLFLFLLLRLFPWVMNSGQFSHSKIPPFGVPIMARWLTNPTRNHEVVGSIPGLAHWVKDLALS